jgi:hypothetical protein
MPGWSLAELESLVRFVQEHNLTESQSIYHMLDRNKSVPDNISTNVDEKNQDTGGEKHQNDDIESSLDVTNCDKSRIEICNLIQVTVEDFQQNKVTCNFVS